MDGVTLRAALPANHPLNKIGNTALGIARLGLTVISGCEMEVPASAPQLGHEVPDSKPPKAGEDSTAATATATATATSANQDGRKRKLDHDGFRMSKYFKICSIVKELRPFFVEVDIKPDFLFCVCKVSRTPNFRDGKYAFGPSVATIDASIPANFYGLYTLSQVNFESLVQHSNIGMKSLIELTKQLRTETSIAECCETPVKEPLSAVVKEENIEKHPEGHKQAPPPPLPGEDRAASVNAIENGIRGSLEESLLNNAKSISEK
ncbi:hypothetical protein MA16_Dca012355 [Dendrobium catenatum]|uniref:Uncharacterized protein n=1 Tax=Dendrobium catenatum TaxID=906689 RepID=A0A2I0VHZ9_9ASPA|nr:hypothetical protein MA16_Dca012355 [Dendrobium catenatum]